MDHVATDERDRPCQRPNARGSIGESRNPPVESGRASPPHIPRERIGSPTLQTLQEPILRTPWVCFRGGGFPNPRANAGVDTTPAYLYAPTCAPHPSSRPPSTSTCAPAHPSLWSRPPPPYSPRPECALRTRAAPNRRSGCISCEVGDSHGRRRRGLRCSEPPRQEMPNLEDLDSDDSFDDFPDVDGWGFGFGT